MVKVRVRGNVIVWGKFKFGFRFSFRVRVTVSFFSRFGLEFRLGLGIR